ncbi:MAG: ATP-binding protein [Bacteroidota bacterium]
MKIIELSYHDKKVDWSIESITFKPFNLLVGASGVGKTRILQAIWGLKKVVGGDSLNGVKWEISFESGPGKEYWWRGEFETVSPEFKLDERAKIDEAKEVALGYEELRLNGQVLVSRTKEEVKFHGTKTPKLSPTESLLSLFREEDDVKPAYLGFRRILFSEFTNPASIVGMFFSLNLEGLIKKYPDQGALRESDEIIQEKLFVCYKNGFSAFESIRSAFRDIFPIVTDLRFELLEEEEMHSLPNIIRKQPVLQIKEEGIDRWIPQTRVSSGMYRTLMHLSELFLCSDGTVVLIDEFENSLGINCINDLTMELLSADRDLQFIITSHHPYIINNISFDHWKLITRQAGKVFARDASELSLGKSKHDAFLQLINLEQYRTGIELR